MRTTKQLASREFDAAKTGIVKEERFAVYDDGKRVGTVMRTQWTSGANTIDAKRGESMLMDANGCERRFKRFEQAVAAI